MKNGLLARFIAAIKSILLGRETIVTVSLPFPKMINMAPTIENGLILQRLVYTDKSTIGELYFQGDRICYTLEPTSRRAGKGPFSIPSGSYGLRMEYSPKFKYFTPHLLEVPGRSYIMIHPGNFPEDTEGCILVGKSKGEDMVKESRMTYLDLVPIIEENLKKGEFKIHVHGGLRA